jgi:hypothetical protein
VCSVRSRERSIYRVEQGSRGRVVVDMLAASPASGWARRGCGRVLLVQAKLGVVLAWSGGVRIVRVASMSCGGSGGIFFPVYGDGGPGSGWGHVWRCRGGVVMLNG